MKLLLVLCTAIFGYTWPPDTSDCAACHADSVLIQPACPGNTVVRVAHTAGGGAISFSQFLNEVGTISQRTYVIAASAQPYVFGCRQVNIGGWSVSEKRTCITIRGETGKRGDVILAGADPEVDPNFWKSSEYGGPSSCGIGQHIQIVNAENIVIADLTMRNFAGKMLKIDGGTDWYPKNIRFHNLDLWDCGSQMIKGAGATLCNRNGTLECSYLHYTTGMFDETDYESQGIDIHEGRNWLVRDNVFENFRKKKAATTSGTLAAVLFWDRTDSVLVERNLIINCTFPIKLSATWYFDTCDNLTARNNVIINDEPDTNTWLQDDVFSIGTSVRNGGVYHNTVWNPTLNYGYAFALCSNNYPIRNNLYLKGTAHRCNGVGDNLIIGAASWFTDVPQNDFGLTANRTVPYLASVPVDIRGKTRANPASAGAFEYGQDAVKEKKADMRVLSAIKMISVFDIRGNKLNYNKMNVFTSGVYMLAIKTDKGLVLKRHLIIR